MLTILALMAAIWLLGALLKLPKAARAIGCALLWGAVVLAQLVLPETAPLRQATGGRVEPWLVLGGAALLFIGYRRLLLGLRRKARPAPATPEAVFSPVELSRYSRHLLLREIGGPGQLRLKRARVLIVGAGGLGSPAVMYLAASGVGQIRLIDDDKVELSNLQRQIAHTDARLGMAKASSARAAALAINPHVEVIDDQRRLDEALGRALIAEADLVLDGTDNFDTRYLVNRLCAEAGKPLIAAAVTQWEGQISLYHPASGGPCFECLFPTRPADGLAPACSEAGVAAPLVGVVGSMMALEAVKQMSGAGEGLRGKLMIYDGLYGDTRILRAKARPGCKACGAS